MVPILTKVLYGRQRQIIYIFMSRKEKAKAILEGNNEYIDICGERFEPKCQVLIREIFNVFHNNYTVVIINSYRCITRLKFQ